MPSSHASSLSYFSSYIALALLSGGLPATTSNTLLAALALATGLFLVCILCLPLLAHDPDPWIALHAELVFLLRLGLTAFCFAGIVAGGARLSHPRTSCGGTGFWVNHRSSMAHSAARLGPASPAAAPIGSGVHCGGHCGSCAGVSGQVCKAVGDGGTAGAHAEEAHKQTIQQGLRLPEKRLNILTTATSMMKFVLSADSFHILVSYMSWPKALRILK